MDIGQAISDYGFPIIAAMGMGISYTSYGSGLQRLLILL